MKKAVIPFIGLIILVGTLLTISFRTPKKDLKIYASKDSFANKYAEKHHLEYKEVAESEKDKFFISIENFEFKNVEGGLELNEYLGVSSYLVIPESIGGKDVVSIEKSLYENKNIETLILPVSITHIDDTKLKVECANSKYCESLVEEGKATMLNDSAKIDFNNYDGIVKYNLKDEKIEVTESFNLYGATLIPRSINGYDVTEVNVDTENIKNIYIPDSVDTINLKNVSNDFIYILIGSIGAYILYLIMVLTNSSRGLNSITKNVSLYIVSVVYLAVVSYFSFNYSSSYYISVIVCSLVYICISSVLKIYKKQNLKYEDKVTSSGTFIEECLALLDKVDKDNKYSLRDKIRYSDPVSIGDVQNIENEIKESLHMLNDDSRQKVEELIKERNAIIKNRKR